ncbi:MAG: undecaprenyldiphospho-muramoylpentapeptide beta-N-acetylglucosaminyltransferase [Desulforudis sp.]|jgi:UDP-N-acetylglucosamine--N-acetylmuramyl-(pentapeptide) pyrophosphoryl-undecaprenol N-acetylglucosamine transferase|nr:MAG: undecaprenyldiphospho-muramoylpentapeptide beta-N-acetylglucosaminyltransferase [Desulforudis sp.]
MPRTGDRIKPLRFLITGGGTGGHIYPALAVAGGLRDRHPEAEIIYVGTDRGLEAKLVPKAGFEFYAVPAQGLKRQLNLANLLVPWRAGKGYLMSRRLIRQFAPHVVVGTGGYVCGPVVMAASRQGIPTFIHEQNALPGLTNRLLSRFADRTAVTFVDAVKQFPPKARVILTGLPVRPEILQADRKTARKTLSIGESEQVLLSFGGSQGARSINKALIATVQHYAFQKGTRLFHASGPKGYSELLDDLAARGLNIEAIPNVTIASYFYEIADLLAAADLVVCRAGASTLAEITVLGCPSILIPYPFATANHQEHNAQALARRGAAVAVRDSELDEGRLHETIVELLSNPHKLAALGRASREMGKPRALDNILDVVERLAGGQTR